MTGRVNGQRGPGGGSFYGRAGQGEFWFLFGINVVVAGVASTAPAIGPLLAIPWVLGALAVTARRLHDMQRSAWWMVLPILAGLPLFTVLAVLISLGLAEGPRPTPPLWTNVIDWLAGLWIVASLVLFCWIGFFPGSKMSNRFGEADKSRL